MRELSAESRASSSLGCSGVRYVSPRLGEVVWACEMLGRSTRSVNSSDEGSIVYICTVFVYVRRGLKFYEVSTWLIFGGGKGYLTTSTTGRESLFPGAFLFALSPPVRLPRLSCN